MHRSCRSFVALCLLVVVVAVGTPATVLAQRSEDVAQAESNRQPMPTLVVYALKYVEAADCAEILSALLEQRGGAGGFSAAPQVRIAVEPRRNTLIVSGTEEQTNMVGDLLKLLDQPTDPVFQPNRFHSTLKKSKLPMTSWAKITSRPARSNTHGKLKKVLSSDHRSLTFLASDVWQSYLEFGAVNAPQFQRRA